MSGPNSQPSKISRSDGRGPTTGSASPSPTTSTGRPTTYSVDDAEKQKFMAAFKELNPDWKPDEDSILYDEDAPYKGFLHQKALGRF